MNRNFETIKGFTLLETLVGLALLGIILSAVFQVMQRSTVATSQLDTRNDLLGETQLAQNYMVAKLREAAFAFPPSTVASIPANITLNSTGYTMYNPATGNYNWRLGTDPVIAFVVPPKNVTPGACDASTAATRPDNCYAFYAFYAIPRSQMTVGVPGKGTATGTNALTPSPQNDERAWVLMEYRAYYKTAGYSVARNNIPSDGNAFALLDFVLPATSTEPLFAYDGSTVSMVTLNLATQQLIGANTVRVPGAGRYTVRVYPRNLGTMLPN